VHSAYFHFLACKKKTLTSRKKISKIPGIKLSKDCLYKKSFSYSSKHNLIPRGVPFLRNLHPKI
jgi:hypothetical protein